MHDMMRMCRRRYRFVTSTTRCTRRCYDVQATRESRCRSCCAGRRLGWRRGHPSRNGWLEPGGGPQRFLLLRCWQHWTSGAASGQMLVVDASCLFEVVADTPRSSEIASRLADDVDQLAPHVIDV